MHNQTRTTTAAARIDVLRNLLPHGSVLTDPCDVEPFRRDRSNDPDVGVPVAVVRPTTAEEVAVVVRHAAAHRVPVVPRGAGSGLSGGSTAQDGAIVLSLDLMRAVHVDAARRMATVQPGALNAEVKAAAAAHGLWYPPDPASYEFCSIGGNVATNAGGLCCVKYGVTSDYVLGMSVVLADGRCVRLGGPRLKDTAGLSLTKLFVGSEGTLGIITEVVLRLVPQQRSPATLVATFSSLEQASDAVVGVSAALRPSMLELMDRATIRAVDDAHGAGLDRDAAAMLLIQSDEPAEWADAEVSTAAELCRAAGGTSRVAATREEADRLVALRRGAIPAVERGGTVLLEDVGVPLDRLGDLVSGIAGIGSARDTTIAVIAHAGDGNTHPLVVFDPADRAAHERAVIAYGEVMDLAVQLGGTITGEHGVGRTKKAWLGDYLGEDVLELNERIKHALDPEDILNPGAVFGR